MGELTHTVIGNPTVFKSADKSEIKSLKVYFNPVQRGDGDPSPSNIKPIQGWTKIKYFKVNNLISLEPINFTPIEANGGTLNYLGNNTFYLSGAITKNTTFTFPIPHFTLKHGHIYNKVIIVESQGEGVYGVQSIGFGFRYGSATKQSLIFTPAQEYINSFNSSTEWTPEDEEIDTFVITFRTGWSNVKVKVFMTESTIESETIPFPAIGKNLIDTNALISTDPLELNHICIGQTYQTKTNVWKDGSSYVTNVSTSNNTISFTAGQATAYGISYCLKLTPEETYCISGITSNIKTRVMFFDSNKQYISSTTALTLNTDNFTVPANAYYSQVIFTPNNSSSSVSISNIQLELGSTCTAYEAPSHILYGGYIDLISGKLVLNYVKSILDENTIIKDIRNESSAIRFRVAHGNYGPAVYSNNNLKFSYLSFDNTQGVPWGGYITVTSGASYGNLIIRLPATYNTEEKIKAYLKDHPLEVGYRIYPIEYQLTPQQMQTFLGENCFLAASNGDVEIEYAFTDHLAKRKLILNEPHTEFASGSIASFSTDMKTPVKELKAYFAPVQEGSGDPSKHNIRPIKGWSNANIGHVKTLKNIEILNFQSSESNGLTSHLNADGSLYFSGTSTAPAIFNFDVNETILDPDIDISFLRTNLKEIGQSQIYVQIRNNDTSMGVLNYLLNENWDDAISLLTIKEPISFNKIRVLFNGGTSNVRIAPMFASLKYVGDFERINVAMPSNEIAYGGHIDLTNGLIYSDYWTLSNVPANAITKVTRFSDYDVYYFNLVNLDVIPESDHDLPHIFSESIKVVSWEDRMSNARPGIMAAVAVEGVDGTQGVRLQIFTEKNEYSSIDEFASFLLAGKTLLKRSIPVSYRISPIKMCQYTNSNHIWSNINGPIEIKYWTH